VFANLNKYYVQLVVTYQCRLDTNPYDQSARKLKSTLIYQQTTIPK